MIISGYLKNFSKRYRTGISRKHAYRGDSVYNLLMLILQSVMSGSTMNSNSGTFLLKISVSYIGGYQLANKWLKGHLGRTLTMEEIQHYQNIIVAL